MATNTINLGAVTNAADTTPWFPAGPGTYTVVVKGTFDGGTVSIQASDDDGATVLGGGTNCDFTANGFRTLEIGEGMKVRATIAGEGATADVDVLLRPMKAR
jgi:hypothetical protein